MNIVIKLINKKSEKNVKYISFQKENFQNNNKFLMYFIETCKDN